MSLPPVSVVVVSRHRPDDLRLCILGLSQLDYPHFEIVVVCDPASRFVVNDPAIKVVVFDDANISAARNIGLAQAAGELVAFIDDDAVPEPTWLRHLASVFADARVEAAGGYVRGRNGISYQWRASLAFPDGRTEPLPIEGDSPRIFEGEPGRAVRTEGTNMAFRRDTVVRLGGFDPAYRYYLDETDLNLRMAAEGLRTAIIPLAQVHHGFANSDTRTANRAPRDLREVGASSAVFARKFARGSGVDAARTSDRAQQRTRLLRAMVRGDLMPGDVRRLLKGFDAGWEEGMSRDAGTSQSFDAPPPFRPFTPRYEGHRVLSGRFWQARRLRAEARQIVQSGKRVSLYLWSYSTLYHRVRFTPDGVWEQRGGQFGRSRRSDPVFSVWRAKRRTAREVTRTARIRAQTEEHR